MNKREARRISLGDMAAAVVDDQSPVAGKDILQYDDGYSIYFLNELQRCAVWRTAQTILYRGRGYRLYSLYRRSSRLLRVVRVNEFVLSIACCAQGKVNGIFGLSTPMNKYTYCLFQVVILYVYNIYCTNSIASLQSYLLYLNIIK